MIWEVWGLSKWNKHRISFLETSDGINRAWVGKFGVGGISLFVKYVLFL
jgi:hypothetical protein